MIKKIIAGVCLIFSAAGFSQESSSSPYSYYGIGDVKFKGTVENRSMGGLSILPDSIHINLQNPGSYSSLKWTTYTVGLSTETRNFQSDTGDDSAKRTTFDYLAIALPFNKFGVAFGLMPYTSVGYRIQNVYTNPTDEIQYFRQFTGVGGINRAFVGASYKVSEKFSVGADFRYNFGSIETKSIVGAPSEGVQYPTREINKSRLRGASFNIGAMYQTRLNKLDWTTSATFSPKSKLESVTYRNIATITLTNSGDELIVDEVPRIGFKDELDIPSAFTIGTGIGEARKWFTGVEFSTQGSNTLSSRFDQVTNADFKAAQRISLGGYYIPKYMSFTSYLSRVTYRAGLKYEKTGLVINDEDINDLSFTLGFGLPLGGNIGASNLNIGFEVGQRGTTKSNLIKENYFGFMASLSINDRWFIKRRYD